MQDPIGIPACFSSGEKTNDDHQTAVTRSGQSVFLSIYRAKIAGQSRLITITWCKNLMIHGLSVALGGKELEYQYTCKVELKPWYFWRKQGSKRFAIEGDKAIDIHWDLKNAKFNGETEPVSDYFVAVVFDKEVLLLLGDLKKDAYRKTGSRPSLFDPILVSRKEHIFGKKRFCTKVKFHDKGRFHDISIQCKNTNGTNNSGNGVSESQPEMEIRVDGHVVIHVKHLQWKFRGNESVQVSNYRVEVCWDVHDWLFNPGLRHALFIFKPFVSSSSSSSQSSLSNSSSSPISSMTESVSSMDQGNSANGSSEFCFFLHAWKLE